MAVKGENNGPNASSEGAQEANSKGAGINYSEGVGGTSSEGESHFLHQAVVSTEDTHNSRTSGRKNKNSTKQWPKRPVLWDTFQNKRCNGDLSGIVSCWQFFWS